MIRMTGGLISLELYSHWMCLSHNHMYVSSWHVCLSMIRMTARLLSPNIHIHLMCMSHNHMYVPQWHVRPSMIRIRGELISPNIYILWMCMSRNHTFVSQRHARRVSLNDTYNTGADLSRYIWIWFDVCVLHSFDVWFVKHRHRTNVKHRHRRFHKMVLDPIPQSLPVHFFGSRPQPPTSPDTSRNVCTFERM